VSQLNLLGDWISGDDVMPVDGQQCVKYYESETGEVIGPVAGKAVYIDGKYIYRKIVWWLPIPALPVN